MTLYIPNWSLIRYLHVKPFVLQASLHFLGPENKERFPLVEARAHLQGSLALMVGNGATTRTQKKPSWKSVCSHYKDHDEFMQLPCGRDVFCKTLEAAFLQWFTVKHLIKWTTCGLDTINNWHSWKPPWMWNERSHPDKKTNFGPIDAQIKCNHQSLNVLVWPRDRTGNKLWRMSSMFFPANYSNGFYKYSSTRWQTHSPKTIISTTTA